jgi:hypothetical protein
MRSRGYESKTVRRVSAALATLFLAASTGLFGAQSASALDGVNEGPDQQVADATGPTIVIEHDGLVMTEFDASSPTQSQSSLLEQALREGTVLPSTPGTVTPQVSIGMGWYIYVYLNSNDISKLATAGASGAAGILCGGGWSGVACAAAAATIVSDLPTPPPAGYCVELRFVHGTTVPLPPKLVKRSC